MKNNISDFEKDVFSIEGIDIRIEVVTLENMLTNNNLFENNK